MTSQPGTRPDILWAARPGKDGPDWAEDEDGTPTVRVDLDAAPDHWPALHPGIHDAHGGHRAHRVRATFTVAEASATVLCLEYTADRGPCPDLELVFDGQHRAVFHPGVERTDRTRTGEPGPVAGHGTLRIPLPAAWLAAGRHELTITTVYDEAAATGAPRAGDEDVSLHTGEALPEPRTHYAKWFGSYLRWTGIHMESRDAGQEQQNVQWALRATPLYRHSPDGPLPLVELTATVPAGAPRPRGVRIDYAGGSLAADDFAPAREFGMLRWRLPAPRFETGADFTVTTDGVPVHSARLTPTRRWTLHLIPHVHLDLGFTDNQAKAVELHCRNIDRALDQLERDASFRFSVDGSYVVDEYLQRRSPQRCARLRRALADGHIGVNAFHSNLLTGIAGLDDLRRSLDFGRELPAGPGAIGRYANITDVPTYSGVLPTVLRAAGIDAFVGMSNHHRAATDDSDEVHLRSPVRWRGRDGSEVLAHFADHYSQLRFIAADPQAVAGAADGLDRFIARYERPDYLPEHLAVIGTHADNEDLADGDAGFAARWNETFAYPRFEVSTFAGYLNAIAPIQERLPVHTAEGGSFWEDGVAASAADAATVRRAQALLPAVETLDAGIALLDGRHRPHQAALDRAWEGLHIGAEHTWTWARTTAHPHAPHIADQLAWKRRGIDDADKIALDESRRALSCLADSLGLDGPGILVYNPHSWTASLSAELDLPTASSVLAADGAEVPVEVLSECAGMRRVRIATGALPAHGWRFLPLSDSGDTVPAGIDPSVGGAGVVDERTPVDPTEAGGTVRSGVWEVRLRDDDGLPISLRHVPSGCELLDGEAPHALGTLVRLTAPDANDRPHSRAMISQLDSRYHGSWTEQAATHPRMRLLGSRQTPEGVRLRWEGAGAGMADIRLELLLRDADEACELSVEFDKLPVLDMESVSIAFPFRVPDATVRYDRQLGWVRPAEDHGPGASNEWLCATSAVTVTGPDGEGVCWAAPDTPLLSSSAPVRGSWPRTFTDDGGHVYAYVLNNFWPCNTAPMQPGPVRFRYVFTPVAEVDPIRDSRFGAEARLGALASEVTALDRFPGGRSPRYQEGTVLPAAPDGCRMTLAVAEDGHLAVRLVNQSDTDRMAELPALGGIAKRVPIAPYGMVERPRHGVLTEGDWR